MTRTDKVLRNKAGAKAAGLGERRGLDFQTAFLVTDAVWRESRRSLKRLIGLWGEDEWKRMSFADKAEVCRVLVRALLDRERVAGFIAGNRKTLV